MTNEGKRAIALAPLLDSWRSDLADWAIPEHIIAAVTESPWVLPRGAFSRRADRPAAAPSAPAFPPASASLHPPAGRLKRRLGRLRARRAPLHPGTRAI